MAPSNPIQISGDVMITYIDLCSLALIKLGASGISSFDDGTVEAQVASAIYPIVKDSLLSVHPWNFATAQKVIPKLSQRPVADYQNAFQLPPDCLRVLSAGSSGRGRGLTYKIHGRQVLTDFDDVTITYIYRAPEAVYPPFFNLALIARLAAEFCIPLTDSTSRWEGMQKVAEDELRRAKLCDAQEDTPPGFLEFNLVESRF